MDPAELESTNRLRKSLGLPALPVPNSQPAAADDSSSASDSDEEPASTLETREAAGYSNWKELRDSKAAKQRRDAKAAAVKKARDAAQRFVKLEGEGLGDLGEAGDLDARAWLKASSKRQKKIEEDRKRRLEEELAERDKLAAVQYSSKDLEGVAIGHEVGAFNNAEGEQILTLKDAEIVDDEEDELEALELREKEKLKEKLELKKRRPAYDPNEEDGEASNTILSHYDEEIEGKKRKAFHLDSQGATIEEREAKRQSIGLNLRVQPISLDILKDLPRSDYLDISEVKIKKPKKSKKAIRKRDTHEDDIFPINAETADGQPNGDVMNVDGERNSEFKPKPLDSSFVDDEDLSASLAAQRRLAFKKRKHLKPEDIVKQIQTGTSESPEGAIETEGVGLIIDETTEFVENLKREPEEPRRTRKAPAENRNGPLESEDEDEDGDAKMTHGNESQLGENEESRRGERETATPELTATGLEEEQTLDTGVGTTMTMLRQRNLILSSEMGNTSALHRERQRFLSDKNRQEALAEQVARSQREQVRSSTAYARMSGKEREDFARHQNQMRDQYESKQLAEKFNREYKPDVNIEYIDEFGRYMNQKEAFKHLSHAFHGKGSGNQKTAKKLKKIEQEKQKEAMSALDASKGTGMNNAMGTTAKKNKQAGVRLA